jgi:hypothetical protein
MMGRPEMDSMKRPDPGQYGFHKIYHNPERYLVDWKNDPEFVEWPDSDEEHMRETRRISLQVRMDKELPPRAYPAPYTSCLYHKRCPENHPCEECCLPWSKKTKWVEDIYGTGTEIVKRYELIQLMEAKVVSPPKKRRGGPQGGAGCYIAPKADGTEAPGTWVPWRG